MSGSDRLDFGHNLFGYTTLVREGGAFVALTGETEAELRVGMRITLLGNSRGYVPSGFRHGQNVQIINFTEPFKNGESDHIIEVTDGQRTGWIKPSNVQRAVNASRGGSVTDRRHRELRSKVHPAAAELLDAVYQRMSEADRASLPATIGEYCNAMVGFALSHLEEFGDKLAEAVARVYKESPHGERFLQDPIRSSSIVDAHIFLDHDGELISVKNPELVWDTSIPAELVIARYESYEILSGPLRGKRYSAAEVGLLGEPVYRAGRALTVNQASQAPPVLRKVFLCHSTADKEAVHRLHKDLRRDGAQPWLDVVDIPPGVEWRPEIERQVRASDFVLVCLSRSSIGKTGFVQREIAIALDAAQDRPEGAVYIIPARLETCDIPARLSRWQSVDLFERDGYSRLLKALTG